MSSLFPWVLSVVLTLALISLGAVHYHFGDGEPPRKALGISVILTLMVWGAAFILDMLLYGAGRAIQAVAMGL